MTYWNFPRFFILLGITALLIGSWLFPLTRPLWDALDRAAFEWCQACIRHSSLWQQFWAVANYKTIDWFHDLFIASFFIAYIGKKDQIPKSRKIAQCLFSISFITAVILLVNKYFVSEVLDIRRDSPTMVYSHAIHLSEKIDWIFVKDYSKTSFPGDHATTAFLFAAISFVLLGKKRGFIALAYACLMCLPRLVSGAHWLTDDLIGSGSIALLSVALATCTPLASYSIALFEKIFYLFSKKSLHRDQT